VITLGLELILGENESFFEIKWEDETHTLYMHIFPFLFDGYRHVSITYSS
jgi:hypothetical protein